MNTYYNTNLNIQSLNHFLIIWMIYYTILFSYMNASYELQLKYEIIYGKIFTE